MMHVKSDLKVGVITKLLSEEQTRDLVVGVLKLILLGRST